MNDDDRPHTIRWTQPDGRFLMNPTTYAKMAARLAECSAVIATKCARCDVTFQGETDAELSISAALHVERCFVVGDYVRWWPDGSDADGLAMAHRWIDGTVEALRDRHITGLRITGSHGFAERALGHGWILPAVGAVMDTTVSPGTIRRIQRPGQPVITTCPGYNATFTVDENWTCHACGGKYSEADEAAHRAQCPGYDAFVKTMEHLAAPIRKTSPASPREWVKPVTRDPTSGMLVPATPDEWHEILKSAGVHESILASGPLIYQQTVTGWNSKHVGTMHVEVTGDPTGSTGWQPAGIPLEPPPRPDGFDPESIAAIKREMLKPVVKVKR